MVQQQGAPSVPELVELAGHKAHLERERALSRIEQLLEGAGGAAMQLTVCCRGKINSTSGRRRRRRRSTRRAAWPGPPAAQAAAFCGLLPIGCMHR